MQGADAGSWALQFPAGTALQWYMSLDLWLVSFSSSSFLK
jgi:hypothetical protein